MQEPIQEPMPVTTDPLLYRSNYFDAKELFALRELYGYGIISRDNMFRHLRILSEYPFLIDGMLISCNGGARATNIHSDAWLNFLSKITYGSPEELALLCFEMCSQGEGRVHYSDVMRVAKAANNIIQSHPLTALADARAGQQENAQTFLQNVGTNDPCLATSSLGLPQKPQNMSVYEVNHQGINKYANGMVSSDNVPSEHGDEWSPGGNGFGVSGIGTRNGGYESLSLPEDVVDYLFSAKKRSTESKITGKSYVSYKEFLYKAKFIPEVSRCFGFFDFLYFLLIAPVITKLRDIPTLENFVKVSKKTAGIKRRYHYCTVQLRDRFLIVTRKGRMHPWISLPLWHTFTQVKGRKMHTISIMSSDLEIKIRAPNLQDAALWVHCIRGNSRGNNLYDSFAPPRPNNICKWFINGKSYFDSLISIIPKAEKQILIIGWAFSPRMFLNRPDDPREQAVLQNDPAYRRSYHAHMQQHKHLVELIDLLVDRARAGVKVRVLVWNETNWGYMLNSHINKDMLEDIHENLEVVRHPPVVPLRWSHHQKMVVIDQRIAFIGGIDLVVGRYDDKYNRVCDPEGAIFPGNDYNNLVIGGVEAGDPKITQLDRRIQPRLPWHDTAVCVVGPAAYDAATSIIQIWNHAIGHVAKGKKYTRLVPFPYLHEELFARGNVENAIFHVGNKPPARPGRVSSGMTCQIVRSISPWASGQNVESSYYRAMLDSIRQAHHFVYIQNQYFISSIMHDIPGNKVALAIVERISLAIQTGKRFRVYIVLPVHSAGPVTSFATRAIIKWTRHTIFQGKESIYGKLRQRFSTVNPRDYISVCALRNWQIANDIVFTEQVYVHSKLLIVDDRIVVIGSGNINDRSMRGARDSETGVVISGGERTVTLMDGQPTEVSRFIQSMRIKLWNVHLGLYQSEHGYALAETRPIANINPAEMHAAEMQVSDAVADGTFYGVWNRTASHNTAIFAEVFGNGIVEHWPSSKHGKRDFYNNVTPLVVQKLSSVRGHLIEFPEDMFARDRGFMMWLLTKRFKVNLVV